MALPNTLRLFIDPKANMAFPNFESGTSISNPSFYLGDTTLLELYLIDNSTGTRRYIDWPASPVIKMAIGDIDTPPAGGSFTLTFGANTTSALAYNITAADLQTALNALTSVTSAGGVTVTLIGNNYAIAFNSNGARTDITSNSSALIPLAAATVTILQQGTSVLPEIALVHLQTLVAGYTNTFTANGSPSSTITTLSSWANNRVNYKLKLNNCFRGSFTLSYQRTGTNVTFTTGNINYNATASDISNAFNDIDYTNVDGTDNGLRHSVIKNDDDSFSISFYNLGTPDSGYSNQPGTNGLTCSVAGIESNPGYSGELALNTSSAISLLGGGTARSTAMAISVTAGGKTQTIYQSPCVLYSVVLDEGVITPVALDTYVTLTQANSLYMSASSVSGFTFPDSSTQASAAYTKAYVDANLLTKATADTYYTATGTTVLRNGTLAFTGNQSFGGFNITNCGTMAATVGNITTVNTGLVSVDSGLLILDGSGITYSDATIQTSAYPGPSGANGVMIKSNNLSDLGSASTARTNLGLGTIAVESATSFAKNSDNLSGLISASTARTNLGLGTMAIQNTGSFLTSSNNLIDLVSPGTARTNLGLGTIAVEAAGDYLAKSDNLTGLTSLSTARTNLGLGTIATYADAPADSNYYVRRNNAWTQAVVYTTGSGTSAKNYLTI